jgi:uncharacterized protein (DUF983 family)
MVEGSIGMAQNDGWLGAMKRGLKRCCPRCGAGGMFTGYLKVAKTCHRCGLDFDSIRSDDVAPYFTILIVGHIVIPAMLITQKLYDPSNWTLSAIFLPLTLVLALGLLRPIKGATVGAMLSFNMLKSDVEAG